MKFVGASTRAWVHYGNVPKAWNIIIDVEEYDLGYMRDAKFEAKKLSRTETAYRAQKDIFGRYYLHDSSCQYGFGGREFNLTLTDDSKVKVKGPWSSSAASINHVFPEHENLVDVTLRYSKHGLVATSLLLHKAHELVEEFLPDWKLFLTGGQPLKNGDKFSTTLLDANQSVVVGNGPPNWVVVPKEWLP